MRPTGSGAAFPPAAGGDVYLRDGAETSLAVNPVDGNNLVAAYNEAWNFDPDVPESNSADGNVSWTPRAFPDGAATFTGHPYDPWVNAGNAPGEFFSTLIRRDAAVTGQSHVVVARSADGGASFSLFFERIKATFQDREMLDVDRSTARGGGSGALHDGKLYLCYDDLDTGDPPRRLGSFLQVISPSGDPLTEIRTSGSSNGVQMQPVAGITDGTVYLKGTYEGGDPVGVRTYAVFHEILNAGAGPNFFGKSSVSWNTAGQQLGTSGRWGLNGHRIDDSGYLAIDRSPGPRRGYLHFILNHNPNPDDPTLDQGDLYLATSTDQAAHWSFPLIPTATGKTQYFPMLDVDDQGWIHVAYYQNEFGSQDGGVLNASSATLYYTRSTDGGISWSSPVQVNAPENALDFPDPPPDRKARSYYLIGDYAQLRATGTGSSTTVYVVWTGYDKDRHRAFVGDTEERILVTALAEVVPSTSTTLVSMTTTTTMANVCSVSCDDGDPCNGTEACDPATGTCQPGTPQRNRTFDCSVCLFGRGLDDAACPSIPAGVNTRFAKAAVANALLRDLIPGTRKFRRMDRMWIRLLTQALKRAQKGLRKGAVTRACFDELNCRLRRALCVSCSDACPIASCPVGGAARVGGRRPPWPSPLLFTP